MGQKWFLMERAWVRNPIESKILTDIGQCKVNCGNCTLFSWHSESKLCSIVNDENTEICQMPIKSHRLQCEKQEDSPSIVVNNRNCKEINSAIGADGWLDGNNKLMGLNHQTTNSESTNFFKEYLL